MHLKSNKNFNKFNKIAHNAAYKLHKKYSYLFCYDIKDFEQECNIIIYKINNDDNKNNNNNKYIYKSCFNAFRNKVRLNKLSNNKIDFDFDFDTVESQLDVEKWLIIKEFLTSLTNEEQDMLKQYLETGKIIGTTSTKYNKFNKLINKFKDYMVSNA